MTTESHNSLTVLSMRSVFPAHTGNVPVQAAISQYEKADETNFGLVISKTSHVFRGIFDTGASCSVISERVAKQLALRKVNTATVYTAGGAVQQDCYVVNIVLPNNLVIPARRVTAANLHGFDVLVGMDIISRGDFIISNRHGFLSVEFNLYIPYTQ